MKKLLVPLACVAAVIASSSFSFAQSPTDNPNMLGLQSQNSGLQAVPAKGTVKIDGKLDEWDLSGRIWSFADIGLRDQFSVETSAMWDGEALYLALQWHDPTPLFNQVSPKTNPGDGWRSDSVQMRIQTDHISWLTAWHYTGEGTSNVHLVHLKNPSNEKDVDTVLYFGKPGETNLGDGLQMAFEKTGPATYTQEIRVPWQLLYKQKPTLKAGDKIQIGFEFLWGDPTGKTFPTFRYADNMQPGMTNREFFWRARKAWGDVELMAKGDLPLRQYRAATAALAGPVKFKLDLPKEAKRFTLVIEDDKGKRVRNLIADVSPADFATANTKSGSTLSLAWDGRNDDGAIMPAGTYRTRGLWHQGFDAIYDITFYNPGTPPWQTADGVGSWGSNHALPEFLAAAGDWMIIGWKMSEGGSAMIGLNPDGLKRWGELRGASPLAADKDSVYSCLLGEGTEVLKETKLMRLNALDGKYKPFVLDGKERTFPLPLTEIFPGKELPTVTALAAHDGRIAMAFEGGDIAILDGSSAQPLSSLPTGGKITSLAYSDKGELFAVDGGAIAQVGKDGKLSPISTPDLADAGSLAVDHDGNLLVYDRGADQQVKAFSAKGKLLYTAGKKGGRPIRGVYEPQAMASVTAIAVDAKGQIWATEHTNFPRRISVWGKDGKLVRDYVGTTGYAGVGCHLYENDPTVAYVGPIELKLDRATGTSKVTRILWKADETRADEPKSFDVDPQSNSIARRFRSSAGGVQREFMFTQPNYYFAEPSVLFMEDDKGWRPVSAVGLVGHFSGKIGPKGSTIAEEPSGDFAGLSGWDGCIWNDENGDGRVQRTECAIIPASEPNKKGGRPDAPIPLGNSWNNGMNTADLSFLVSGIHRYKPLRFTKQGAPVYGVEGIEKVTGTEQAGLLAYDVPDEKLVIGMRSGGPGSTGLSPVPGLVGIGKGEFLWSYPNLYPGVHGSHAAPMSRAGLLIGPLKIMGVAKVNKQVGNVFAIRGNLGQDYFFTTDGLYAGALFQDCRYPNPSLPETVEEAKGMSLAGFSEGGEPFSGWFGRQSDDKIRIMTSIGRNAGLAVEVKGLETITRFKGPDIHLTDADLEKIASMPAPQPAAGQKAQPYRITHVSEPLPVEGDSKAWNKIPAVTIAKEGSPEKATAQLASDGKTLFIRFAVTDSSPLLNSGNDFKRLFKTGDAVDLQIGPAEPAARKDPGAQDSRLLLSTMQGKPVAVLMSPLAPKAPKELAETYSSPVGQKRFNRVEKLDGVPLSAKKTDSGYTMTAAIPLSALGIEPATGLKLRGDLGFISSDAKGITNMARTYWSNQATGLVNDEPMEAWFSPAAWGEFILD